MAFCHGNGNISTDGCCWVNGQICPLRWKVLDSHILQGPELVDLGTIDEFAAGVSNNRNVKTLIKGQAQGLTFACRAAVDVLVSDPALLENRAGFEQAWTTHPAYQPIADAWEAIGKPRSWCPEYGPAEGQCCYAEPEAENAAKRGKLTAVAVQIRQGRSI